MKMAKSIQAYIDDHPKYQNEISLLRDIISETELDETLKWGIPTYTINNKNVVAIAAFKSFISLWFYQGVFMKDTRKVLINAQEDVTIAQRQWRFTNSKEINSEWVKEYVLEAIQNQHDGLVVKPMKKKPLEIPKSLLTLLAADAELKSNFESLTSYKQREYLEYLISAKLDKTKVRRLEKIVPMIKSGVGLSDKYR